MQESRAAAVVFDLYGTVLNYDGLGRRAAALGIARPDDFIAAWRAKQIEYTWCSTLMNRYRDFDELTGLALDYVLAANKVDLSTKERDALERAWRTLDAYPDVVPALAALRELQVPAAILTNGVATTAEEAVEHAGLYDMFDAILSVDTVGRYKPDQQVYRIATERFETEAKRIVFVSSNGWDATGGAAFGFRVVWCNRAGRAAEVLGFPPAITVDTLTAVPAFAAS